MHIIRAGQWSIERHLKWKFQKQLCVHRDTKGYFLPKQFSNFEDSSLWLAELLPILDKTKYFFYFFLLSFGG